MSYSDAAKKAIRQSKTTLQVSSQVDPFPLKFAWKGFFDLEPRHLQCKEVPANGYRKMVTTGGETIVVINPHHGSGFTSSPGFSVGGKRATKEQREQALSDSRLVELILSQGARYPGYEGIFWDAPIPDTRGIQPFSDAWNAMFAPHREHIAIQEQLSRDFFKKVMGIDCNYSFINELTLEFVPRGCFFQISEYDGSESARVVQSDGWYTA